jgi:hypothetical protein
LSRNYKKSNLIISDLFAFNSTLYEFIINKISYNEFYFFESEILIRFNNFAIIIIKIKRERQINCKIKILLMEDIAHR